MICRDRDRDRDRRRPSHSPDTDSLGRLVRVDIRGAGQASHDCAPALPGVIFLFLGATAMRAAMITLAWLLVLVFCYLIDGL
jgi:hypothetical protein